MSTIELERVALASDGPVVEPEPTSASAPSPTAEVALWADLPAPLLTEPVAVLPEPVAVLPELVFVLPTEREAKLLRRRYSLASLFGWVQFSGILLILFVGWQLWGTSISQHHAQALLKQQFDAHLRVAPAKPQPQSQAQGVSLIPADVQEPEPPEGSVVAHLQIPSIGVDEYVVEGTAEADLDKGPGHYIGTAMPGQAGNVAIAGHRTTYGAPFNNLGALDPGDLAILTTDSGEQLRYVVSQPPFAVSPSDVAVLNSFSDNRLTLTTCNPRFSATQRLVVVALLSSPVSTPASAASAGSSVQPRRTRLLGVTKADAQTTAGWHLSYLPRVLFVLAGFAILGIVDNVAFFYLGRRLRWMILVPLWVAGIYMLFGLVTSLLPATL